MKTTIFASKIYNDFNSKQDEESISFCSRHRIDLG